MAITFIKKTSGGVPNRVTTATGIEVLIGTASAGTNYEIKQFNSQNADAVLALYTEGDLPNAILQHFQSGGATVYSIKLPSTTIGVLWGTTEVRSATSTGAVTFTGTPVLTVDVQIKITEVGDRGTATFVYSVDNGQTFTEQKILTAATYVIGSTGITANFTAVDALAYVVGDIYGVHADGPVGTIANVQTALALLPDYYLEEGNRFEAVRVVGTASKSFATTFATELATFATTNKILATPVLDADMPKAYFECDGSTDKFSIVAPGTGINVIAVAADITPSTTAGKTMTQIATDLATKINAAAAGPAASWAVTILADGSFLLDSSAAAGVTSITIAAPSANNNCTNQLFGTTVDQDIAAETWTGKFPAFENAGAYQSRMKTEWVNLDKEMQIGMGGDIVDSPRGTRPIMNINSILEGVTMSIPRQISSALVEAGDLPGVRSVHPIGLVDETIKNDLVDAGFTIPQKTRTGVLTAAADVFMKSPASNMKYRSWNRVFNHISTLLIDAITATGNAGTSASSISSFQTLWNSTVQTFVGTEITSGSLVIPPGQDFLTQSTITVLFTMVPLGRTKDWELTSSLLLPNPIL